MQNSLMSEEIFSKQDEYFDKFHLWFDSHVALTWLALGYIIHVAKQQICDYFMFSHVVDFFFNQKKKLWLFYGRSCFVDCVKVEKW